jgi:DivIVA domain-containing protein
VTQSYGDLVEAITTARFSPVRVREGYDMAEVDDLLDSLVAALGRGEPVAAVIDGTRLSHVRLREGYDIGEVDRFLERVRRTAPGSDVPVQRAPRQEPAVPVQRGLRGWLHGRR